MKPFKSIGWWHADGVLEALSNLVDFGVHFDISVCELDVSLSVAGFGFHLSVYSSDQYGTASVDLTFVTPVAGGYIEGGLTWLGKLYREED